MSNLKVLDENGVKRLWKKTQKENQKLRSDIARNYLSSTLAGNAGQALLLDEAGLVPTSKLPSYVDDILEFNAIIHKPRTDGQAVIAWGGNLPTGSSIEPGKYYLYNNEAGDDVDVYVEDNQGNWTWEAESVEIGTRFIIGGNIWEKVRENSLDSTHLRWENKGASSDSMQITPIAPSNGTSFDIVFDEETNAFYARTVSAGVTTLHSVWNDPEDSGWDASDGVKKPVRGKIYLCKSENRQYRWVASGSNEGAGTLVAIADGGIYKSSVDDNSEKNTGSFGNIKANTYTAEDLKKKTLSEIIDLALFSDTNPTWNADYTVTMRLATSNDNGKTAYESLKILGATAPSPATNFVYSFKKTTVTIGGKTYNVVGDQDGDPTFKHKKVNLNSQGVDQATYGNSLPTRFDEVGTHKYQVGFAYKAGDQLKTKRGVDYETPKAAGNAYGELSIKVTYPIFSNGVIDNNSDTEIGKTTAQAAAPAGLPAATVQGTCVQLDPKDVIGKGIVINFFDNSSDTSRPYKIIEFPHALKPSGGVKVQFVNSAGKWQDMTNSPSIYTIEEEVKTRYCASGGTWDDTNAQGALSLSFDRITIVDRAGANSIRILFK